MNETGIQAFSACCQWQGRNSMLAACVFLRHPGAGEEAADCLVVAAEVRPHLEEVAAAAARHLRRTAGSGP